MINKTLAILAGGKSSRMNYNNKALLLFKEKTFIESIIYEGKDFNEVIIISNNKEDYTQFDLKIFNDIYLGHGPLAGIHSALKNARNDKVLCIACDMPLITKDILKFISDINEEYEVLAPKINEKLQPLCAIYSKELIFRIEEALINNENKLKKFIMSTKYKVLEDKKYKVLSEREFSNINTINEYNDLEEI